MSGRLLSDLFRRCPGFDVVACNADRPSLVKSVLQCKPDVALISADLRDGQMSGLAALGEIREEVSGVRSILLFDRPNPHVVVEGLRAGARGVFCRSNFEFATLRKCVRRVHEGQLWVGNEELECVLTALSQPRALRVMNSDGSNLLSKREEDVMRLVAEGMGNREIAQALDLSEHTVKNYLFHIFDKLGISNRVELVLYAVSMPKIAAPVTSQKRDQVTGQDFSGRNSA